MGMGRVKVFENRPPVLGINSLGRIGKLTLWHHIGRKYFQEIVVNLGREAGAGLNATAQFIEKDAMYGLIHRFLYGIQSDRLIEIKEEKKGKLLVDGIPTTVLREAGTPVDKPSRDYAMERGKENIAMKYINEIDLKGKRVFIRVDFNVPINDDRNVVATGYMDNPGNSTDQTLIGKALHKAPEPTKRGTKKSAIKAKGAPKINPNYSTNFPKVKIC